MTCHLLLCLHTYLFQDFTLLNQANPDLTPSGHVNMDKMLLLASSANKLVRVPLSHGHCLYSQLQLSYQSQPFPFKANPIIQDYILQQKMLPEKSLDAFSMLCESARESHLV